MRINPKLFTIAEATDAIDVQEFDGRKIEIFHMDDYPKVKEEFINKGKFAVWSSVDGVNYRVFIEKGYHQELSALYTKAVNKIWVDFWDTCEVVSRKTSYRIILPVTIVAVAACIGLSFIPNQQASFFAMLGIVVVAFVVMLFFNRLTKKKIYDANVKSVEEIKKCVGGSKNFDALIEAQKNYMDAYYDALYPSNEEEEDSSLESEQIEAVNEEQPEAVSEEEPNALEEQPEVVSEEKAEPVEEASTDDSEVEEDSNLEEEKEESNE